VGSTGRTGFKLTSLLLEIYEGERTVFLAMARQSTIESASVSKLCQSAWGPPANE
jgi:hypothetical protein